MKKEPKKLHSFMLPKRLGKRLKIQAAKTETSQGRIVMAALEAALPREDVI